MESAQLGRSAVNIPVIGMGTWQIELNPDESIKALRLGIEKGLRLIDTAESYNNEEVVGKAIEPFKQQAFVSTKVYPTHFHYNDVLYACEQSLQTLGLKSIDLYQLHKPNKTGIPLSETVSAMEELVRQGKIKHIGLCNFSIDEIKEVQSLLKENSIASIQAKYNILSREIESELIGFCKKEKITIIAFEPFAKGSLANERQSKPAELLAETDKRYDRKAAESANKLLGEIGSQYGKSAMQVALNWVVSKGNIIAIPKASSQKHMLENSQACSFKLSNKDNERIDQFYKEHHQS
jgi:diketogulonate reductase-like aldo/keto reductase